MENKETKSNDIKNKQNESKRVKLYTEFFSFQWDKIYNSFIADGNNDNNKYGLIYKKATESYYELFYIIETPSISVFNEANQVIKWIDKNNNGVLPDDLQAIFNEWLLEKKL